MKKRREDTASPPIEDGKAREADNELRIREGIARGERALIDGRVFTHEEAMLRMSRWIR